jgi:hypothetical protein
VQLQKKLNTLHADVFAVITTMREYRNRSTNASSSSSSSAGFGPGSGTGGSGPNSSSSAGERQAEPQSEIDEWLRNARSLMRTGLLPDFKPFANHKGPALARGALLPPPCRSPCPCSSSAVWSSR